MRKYDFYLLGLYVVAFVVALFIIFRVNYSEIKYKKEVEGLLKQKIERVEIIDTEATINFYPLKGETTAKSNWYMIGSLKGYDEFKKLQIIDNILYIEGLDSRNFINIYLEDEIEVNIINAPNVNVKN